MLSFFDVIWNLQKVKLNQIPSANVFSASSKVWRNHISIFHDEHGISSFFKQRHNWRGRKCFQKIKVAPMKTSWLKLFQRTSRWQEGAGIRWMENWTVCLLGVYPFPLVLEDFQKMSSVQGEPDLFFLVVKFHQHVLNLKADSQR